MWLIEFHKWEVQLLVVLTEYEPESDNKMADALSRLPAVTDNVNSHNWVSDTKYCWEDGR